MTVTFLFKFAKKHTFYTAINLAGLSVGIACFWLISVYVRYELNFDAYHGNRDRIFRITSTVILQGNPSKAATTAAAVGPDLLREYPEIDATATFEDAKKVSVSYQDREFPEIGFYKASKDVFRVFSYRMLKGDAATALERPASVVLTETIAKKYFANTDPIGRQIMINHQVLRVTGVMQDLPGNSDLYFTGLISFDPAKVDNLLDFDYYTYVLVDSSAHFGGAARAGIFEKKFDRQLAAFSDKLFKDLLKSMGQDIKISLHAQPMAGMHFDTGYLSDTPKGEKAYLYIFTLIASLILLIVGINYTNLAIAQAGRRGREVGVKKVAGASRGQLFRQFMAESFLMMLIALALAAGIAMTTIPIFNRITGIDIPVSGVFRWQLLPVLLAVCGIVAFLSGIYPAAFLSRLKPATVIKNNVSHRGRRNLFRASLIVTQFVISNGMIACCIIAYRHVQFVRNTDLGFDKNQLVVVYLPADSAAYGGMVAFRNALAERANGGQAAFGGAGSLPGGEIERASAVFQADSGTRTLLVNHSFVDEHYYGLLHVQVVKGRDFDHGSAAAPNASVLVNETLANQIGWKDPIGKTIDAYGQKSTIIGVVRDFHYQSLHNKLEPLVIHYGSGLPVYLFCRLAPTDIVPVGQSWRKYVHGYAFDYHFVDKVFDAEYRNDQRLMTLFSSFCCIAVLLACIGLFGLFCLNTAQRTKEIGIRKVLGGGTPAVIYLLSRRFLLNIVIAILVSTPIAWFCMAVWERNFAYHEKITPVIFLVSGVCSILIAVGTIAHQAVKAAHTNPVRALKTE